MGAKSRRRRFPITPPLSDQHIRLHERVSPERSHQIHAPPFHDPAPLVPQHAVRLHTRLHLGRARGSGDSAPQGSRHQPRRMSAWACRRPPPSEPSPECRSRHSRCSWLKAGLCTDDVGCFFVVKHLLYVLIDASAESFTKHGGWLKRPRPCVCTVHRLYREEMCGVCTQAV